MELIGKKAPAFTLKNKDGEDVKLNNIDSEYTVVYFYPRDNTPGCTIEAKDFSCMKDEFEKAGIKVIGISGGDEKSKTKFVEKQDLTIELVSDPEFKIATKYDSYGLKKFMGREYMGIKRNTFLLNKSKKIINAWENIKVKGHAQAVLDFIVGLDQ